MYESFFGFREQPFSLTPDPRFLWLSETHQEGLAALVYGITRHKGFLLLTGEVSDVESAIEAGAQEIGKRGLLVSRVVVPRPAPELFTELI